MKQYTSVRFHRSVLLAVALCAGAFCFASPAHADPAPAPVVLAAAPAPVPAPPPVAPGLEAPAAVLTRREETVVAPAPGQTAPPPGGANPPPGAGVFQRAAAYLKGREGIAADLATRDRTISSLQQQLGQRDQTIMQLNAELQELRSGRDQLQQALSGLESERRTVVDTVASLGFEQSRLPAAGTVEQAADNTLEGLQSQLKAENDTTKRAQIAAKMISMRNKAAKAA